MRLSSCGCPMDWCGTVWGKWYHHVLLRVLLDLVLFGAVCVCLCVWCCLLLALHHVSRVPARTTQKHTVFASQFFSKLQKIMFFSKTLLVVSG